MADEEKETRKQEKAEFRNELREFFSIFRQKRDQAKSEGTMKAERREMFRYMFSIKEDSASSEEIRKRLLDGGRVSGTNMCVLVCAIIIASTGLSTNSTAVIIGAMLISPLMGTILAIAYGTVTADSRAVRKSLIGFLFQMGVSLITSTIFFLLMPSKTITSELLARTNPSFTDVIVAIAGGIAGIIGQTRKDKSNNIIPGVAIATALMPPLCTCGFSIASGHLRMLLVSLNAALEECIDAIHACSGIAVPAHVMGRENSIMNQLGFIPEDLDYDALEIRNEKEKEEVLSLHPWMKEEDTIWLIDSDAHRLVDISEREHQMSEETLESLWRKRL